VGRDDKPPAPGAGDGGAGNNGADLSSGFKSSTLLQAAASYGRRGLRIFPCAPNEKRPHPRLARPGDGRPGGFYQASSELGRIISWWGEEPRANIGLPTGQPWPDDPTLSLVVLDLDVRRRPDLRRKVDDILADPVLGRTTWLVRTPSGGGHVYVLARKAMGIVNLEDETGPIGELRSSGGYVLVPPSVVDGAAYKWLSPLVEGGLPEGRPLVVDDALAWALALLREYGIEARGEGEARRAAYHILAERPAQVGERNNTLFSYACALRRAGLGYQDILRHLQEMNADPSKVAEPLPLKELEDIASSACRYKPGYGYPSSGAPPAEALERELAEAFSDRNLAHLFAELAKDQAVFVPQWGWRYWDGRRWARDEGGHRVMALAMDIIPRHFLERAIAARGEVRAQLLEMARKAMSRHRLSAALELAKGLLLADPSEFDRDPFALNCLNGTVDLRTGELRPHNPADRITKLAPVEYDPNAAAPTWERFLNDIFLGDQELVAYVQRALGYSITGDTREDCVFIAWGPGRNGKSVFLETVAAVVGDYARSMPPDLILARGEKDDTHPHVLAELAGVRLATISETEEERRLNASRLKALSGRDTLTARHLYRPYFNFRPQAKLWLRTNYRPKVTDHSIAMWERLRLIPFKAYFPPERRDKELPQKLLAEAQGILAWLIRGAQEWLRKGLQEPPAVIEATAAYRTEQDTLGQWLEERTQLDPRAITPFKALYDDYRSWCEEGGDLPLGPRRFATALEERGFAKATLPDGKTKARRGLRLRGDASPSPPAVPPNPPMFQENSPWSAGAGAISKRTAETAETAEKPTLTSRRGDAPGRAFEEGGTGDLLGAEEADAGPPIIKEGASSPPESPPHPPQPCPRCRPTGVPGYYACERGQEVTLLRVGIERERHVLRSRQAICFNSGLLRAIEPDFLVVSFSDGSWGWVTLATARKLGHEGEFGAERQLAVPLGAFAWEAAQGWLPDKEEEVKADD